MLRFISKLNDDLKDQLFILCSATSRYLATITAQLMLRNVVPNSLTSRFIHFLKLFRQKFDNRRADQNSSAAAACRIHWRRRRTGGGAHVCSYITVCFLRPSGRGLKGEWGSPFGDKSGVERGL